MKLRRGFAHSHRLRLPGRIGAVVLALLHLAGPAAGETGALRYMTPPAPIGRILDAASPPLVVPSPSGETLALLSRPGAPPIAELAGPALDLAGLTVDPRNIGPARAIAFDGLRFQGLAVSAPPHEVVLPPGARVAAPLWSPDGSRLAFLILRDRTVELWTASVAGGTAERVATGVSAGFPRPFDWLPDSSGLLVRLVPEGHGPPPEPDRVSTGPIVRESAGRAAPAPTNPGLLDGPYDEALLEYYFTSELAIARLDGTPPRRFGAPGIISDASLSPDGRYVLQHRLKRPFPYSVTASAFPTEILVTDLSGAPVRRVTDRPATAGGAAVPAGPRAVQWRRDTTATLFWAEDGRPSGNATGDRLLLLDAPFTGSPRRLTTIGQRFQTIHWGRGDFALVTATSPAEGRQYLYVVAPDLSGAARLLRTRFYSGGEAADLPLTGGGEERQLRFTGDGGVLMWTRSGTARLDPDTGELRPLWREGPGERLFAPLGGGRLLVWRETAVEPPNLFLVESMGPDAPARRITRFSDAVPELAGVRSLNLAYRRADGMFLRGTLHLPAGYEPRRDGPLPVLIWAYPAARSAAEGAGSATGSGGDEAVADTSAPGIARFVRPAGTDLLPFLLLTRGYALFEADMPIVGTAAAPPMDHYVPQIVANAVAAVDRLVAEGVADRGRIAIGGHSFGAAMVVSLLAHSDLFRTGIAMSGAYNRTLTPFGFQATERRSLWEAPEAYLATSPFLQADRIDEPLLLIHGAADSNIGTWPMQSERLYEAIKGNGGTVRYVLLPHEDHHYRARESRMHVMWELNRWLDAHLRCPAEVSPSGR